MGGRSVGGMSAVSPCCTTNPASKTTPIQMHMLGRARLCLTVRFSGCAQADDESVNETVDEEGEEEEQWAPSVSAADTALEPPEQPPSRGPSEGGVVSFGEVSFGGADSELRVEEGQTRASDDPFAETPAPRTLKDLVESKPFVAAGAKGGGSVGGSPYPAALQLSYPPAVRRASLHSALLHLGVETYRR